MHPRSTARRKAAGLCLRLRAKLLFDEEVI